MRNERHGRRVVALVTTTWMAALVTAAPAHAQYTKGDVFASVGGGLVREYHQDGTLVRTLDTGLTGFTTGSAFDGAGNFYVTDFSASEVSKFNNSGVLQGVFGSGHSTPESIVFDKAGDMYVGNIGGKIEKFNAAGVLQQTYSSTGRVDWMDLAADQRTMYITTEGGSIARFDLVTGTFLSPFVGAGVLAGPTYALRVLGDGGILVANSENIERLSSTGSLLQSYSLGGVGNFFALNLDPNGTSFWSGSINDGKLYEFNIASGAVERTIDTGAGSNALFGVSVFGEITEGGPPPPPTTTPEPSTWALLGTGLLALGGAAKRRRGTTTG